MLVISSNDQFVGGVKELFFSPTGEMIDAQAEMESLSEGQISMAHDMVLQNLPPEMIAQALEVHVSTVKLIAQKAK